MALFSQAKKSEFGMAQLSSCIAGFNILNKHYVRTTARNQGFSQLEAKKIVYRMEKTTEKQYFDLWVQGLQRKCLTTSKDQFKLDEQTKINM